MSELQQKEMTETAVVVPPHEIDASTVGVFRALLFDAVDSHPGAVTVDMAGVEFCDSTGLAALVGAHHRAYGRRVPLVITSPPPSLMALLRLTGLGRVLAIAQRAEPAPACPSS